MKPSSLSILRTILFFLIGMALMCALAPMPLFAAQVPLVPHGVPLSTHAGSDPLPWSALGNGLNNSVSDIAVSGSDMYVGGDFIKVCGNTTCDTDNITVNNIAKWDGSHWSALGNGVGVGNFGGAVSAIAVSGNDIIVAGDFTQICGNAACDTGNTTVNHVAKWDGSRWSALGNGVGGGWYNGVASSLAVRGSDLYMGGFFTDVCGNAACDTGNTTVNHIAKWDGSQWSALDNGVGTGVYGFSASALAVSGSNLYAGGDFAAICGNPDCNTDNTTVNHIAKWDGSQWSALDNGLNGLVYVFAMSGNDLFVGGEFDAVCGNVDCNSENTPAFHIAIWDGSNWSVPGYGFRSNVQALAVHGTTLYAGGVVQAICGNPVCDTDNIPVNHLAKWDGVQWSALDNGVNDVVGALAIKGGEVYVGGIFHQVCGDINCATNNLTVNFIAVNYTSAPAQPTLIAPEKKAIVGKRPILQWNAALDAATYTVFIKNTKTGKVEVKQAGLTALQFKPKRADALTSHITYKWYVQACNPLGCTQSPTRRFTVK